MKLRSAQTVGKFLISREKAWPNLMLWAICSMGQKKCKHCVLFFTAVLGGPIGTTCTCFGFMEKCQKPNPKVSGVVLLILIRTLRYFGHDGFSRLAFSKFCERIFTDSWISRFPVFQIPAFPDFQTGRTDAQKHEGWGQEQFLEFTEPVQCLFKQVLWKLLNCAVKHVSFVKAAPQVHRPRFS